jgi:hypothetical protein
VSLWPVATIQRIRGSSTHITFIKLILNILFCSHRLIDLEAAATSSSMHLLWSIGGEEREALGSKCLAGLQVVSWGLCEEGQRTDSKNVEEHFIVFKRPEIERREGREEVADKVVKGDRMILSIEVGRRSGGCVGSKTFALPVGQSAPHGVCGDIEDLGSDTPHSSSSCSSSCNGLIEPNIATGQVVRVTRSEVHVSLRQRPRRLIRYRCCTVRTVSHLSVQAIHSFLNSAKVTPLDRS